MRLKTHGKISQEDKSFMLNRRDFVKGLLLQGATLSFCCRALAAGGEKFPIVRAITRGPKFHW
jgi:hypothetical protein